MHVSVILTIKNESVHIKNCLDSIIHQSYEDFEIIVVDDYSTDNTLEILNSFNDKRIKLYSALEKGLGHANLRNYALKKASGKYIFFTDGDCVPHYNWIAEGLKIFENVDCVGVEGKTFYETKESLTVTDYYTQRLVPGGFMTCNVAYLKDSIIDAGYFDPTFRYVYEDRDLGMRIKKLGKIYFESNMLVFHQMKKVNIKSLFRRSRRAGDMVYFDAKHGRSSSEYIKKNVLYPGHLLSIFFPPLIFLGARNESIYDLFICFMKYFSFIFERLFIWAFAIKFKKFIV
jgi:glycosyltransferase involved in cell wall biosynthesis